MLTTPRFKVNLPHMSRPSKTEPFRAFVLAELALNPNTLTVEILEKARQNGYHGSYSPFFELVKSLRPEGQRECRKCHKIFSRVVGDRRNAVFCSGACRQLFHVEQRKTLPSKGQCFQCAQPAAGRRLCDVCREKKRAWTNANRLEERKTAFLHYGNKCACPGCLVTSYEFLAFDHVNNDGATHRKELGDPTRLAHWVIINGFPSTIRLLCHNCNSARGIYGYCPHERKS